MGHPCATDPPIDGGGGIMAAGEWGGGEGEEDVDLVGSGTWGSDECEF